MPTIKDKLHFNYGGKSSKDFGVMHVDLGGGMYSETLVASRAINETEVRGNDQPLFHSVEDEPLSFEMTIAFVDKFTKEDIEKVVLWLFQDHYRPLYFYDDPDRVYYCMPVGDASIVHNGLRGGYVTIQMRARSSKIESHMEYTRGYDVVNFKEIVLDNEGHVEIYPEVSIRKFGDGHVSIVKNDIHHFEVRDLTNREEIYIDSEKEIIESDVPGIYRYEDVVGHFYNLSMDVGRNKYTVVGNCEVTFRYMHKYRF